MKDKNCVVCGNTFTPTGQCAKYCSAECRRRVVLPKMREHARNSRLKLGKIKYPEHRGTGKWQTVRKQQEISTGQYGILDYQLATKKECERCGSVRFLLVHHKDRNRQNNHISNLETLCKSCHQREHEVINNLKRRE